MARHDPAERRARQQFSARPRVSRSLRTSLRIAAIQELPMLSWLLTIALFAPAPQGGTPPDAARVEAAVKEIESALASPKTTESAAALTKNAGLADARVVAALAKGLKDARPDVRLAATDALGRTRHADALAALTKYYEAEKKTLRKDPRALQKLLVAVARHADRSSIPLLVDDAQGQLDAKTIEARVLGLANVRAKESVAAVFALADKLGFLEQNTHAENLRLALMVLTGEDRGRALDAWRSWWKEREKTFEVPRELPALPKAEGERWRAFWAAK
jgi:hypothetical protein